MLLELNSRVWLERDTVIAILKGMADLPRIDIVECKECKFSKVYQIDSGEEAVRVCKAYKHMRLVSDDDFCSYGERIDNEIPKKSDRTN